MYKTDTERPINTGLCGIKDRHKAGNSGMEWWRSFITSPRVEMMMMMNPLGGGGPRGDSLGTRIIQRWWTEEQPADMAVSCLCYGSIREARNTNKVIYNACINKWPRKLVWKWFSHCIESFRWKINLIMNKSSKSLTRVSCGPHPIESFCCKIQPIMTKSSKNVMWVSCGAHPI